MTNSHKSVTVNCGVVLTIRRPDGQIERSNNVKLDTLTPQLFARIVKATADAGRGEVLSWEQITREALIPPEYIKAATAEREYNRRTAAVYRAMDAGSETNHVDNTPAHPAD